MLFVVCCVLFGAALCFVGGVCLFEVCVFVFVVRCVLRVVCRCVCVVLCIVVCGVLMTCMV